MQASDYEHDNADGRDQDYNRSDDHFGGGPGAQYDEYSQGNQQNYDSYPTTSAAQRDYQSTNMRQGYRSEQFPDRKGPVSSYDRYEEDQAGRGPYRDDPHHHQSRDDYRGVNDRFHDERDRYERPPLQRDEGYSWREDQRSYDRPATSSYEMGARDRYGPGDDVRPTSQVPVDVRASRGNDSFAGQKDGAVAKDVGLHDKPETVPGQRNEGKDGEEKLPAETKEGVTSSQTESVEPGKGAANVKPEVPAGDKPQDRVLHDSQSIDQPRSVSQGFTNEERPPFREDALYPDDRRLPMGGSDRYQGDRHPTPQYQEAHGSFQRDNFEDNRYSGYDERPLDRGQDRYQDQYDTNHRDIPGQRMDDDYQRLPPRDAPQGMYGRDEFDRLPFRDDPARLPPRDDPGRLPPPDDLGRFPPRDDFGRPLRDDLGRLPPRDDPGRLPPRDDLGRLPSRDDPGRLPPRDDLGRLPPGDDLGRLPPRDDPGRFPPRDDLGRLPPRDDLGRLPPRDDLGRLPPRDDFGRLPARDEYDRLPPRDNYDRLPPRDERDRFPPRDDRYGEESGRLPRRDSAAWPHMREEIGRLSPRRGMHRSISPPRRESFREQLEFDRRYRDWEKQHFPVDDPTREWEYEMRRRELLGMPDPAPVDSK